MYEGNFMVLRNEHSLERWLKIEFHNLNKNQVRQQITIAELLKMDKPKTITREGLDYIFDFETLFNFSQVLPTKYHSKLKLPIYFYKDLRIKDSCFITDDTAVRALKNINALDPMYRPIKDKLWLSRPLAHEIANKYPTLFQFVIY